MLRGPERLDWNRAGLVVFVKKELMGETNDPFSGLEGLEIVRHSRETGGVVAEVRDKRLAEVKVKGW